MILMEKKHFPILVTIAILAIAISSGCVQQDVGTEPDGKINVIVSILPQKAFINSVGGEHVNVVEIISPGSSPATYELTPRDAVNIENADIYFRIGHISFEEAHISRIEYLNPDMLVVDTSEGITLRHFTEDGEHEHDGVDPHTWLSPRNAIIMVESMYDTLADADPEHASEYRKNADAYAAKLNVLDDSLKQTLSRVDTKKLMVFHPAWGYFTDEYGFEQISIEHDGKEPTAEELAHIIDDALEHEVKVIFVQSQFSKEIAQSVAEQIGGIVVQINPLAENYIENLQQVGGTINDYL